MLFRSTILVSVDCPKSRNDVCACEGRVNYILLIDCVIISLILQPQIAGLSGISLHFLFGSYWYSAKVLSLSLSLYDNFDGCVGVMMHFSVCLAASCLIVDLMCVCYRY